MFIFKSSWAIVSRSQQEFESESEADTEDEDAEASGEHAFGPPGGHPVPVAPPEAPPGSMAGSSGDGGGAPDDVPPPPRVFSAFNWGPFNLSKIHRRGVQVGWGAVCGRHNDAGDRPGSQCKKQLAYCGSSDEEAIKLLKIWLMKGLEIDVDTELARSDHLRCIPRSLTNLSEAELEALLLTVPDVH